VQPCCTVEVLPVSPGQLRQLQSPSPAYLLQSLSPVQRQMFMDGHQVVDRSPRSRKPHFQELIERLQVVQPPVPPSQTSQVAPSSTNLMSRSVSFCRSRPESCRSCAAQMQRGAVEFRRMSRSLVIKLVKASQGLSRVKSLSPNHRFVIALQSPSGADQTGLPQCPAEKRLGNFARNQQPDIFSGSV
jgi:hypothetical protein